MRGLVILCLSSFIFADNFPGFFTKYEIDKTPAINSSFPLKLKIKEISGYKHPLKIMFNTPYGIELIKGNVEQRIVLEPFDSTTLVYTLKIRHPGYYRLSADIVYLKGDTSNFWNRPKAVYYIYINGDTVRLSDRRIKSDELLMARPDAVIGNPSYLGKGNIKTTENINIHGNMRYYDAYYGEIRPYRRPKIMVEAEYFSDSCPYTWKRYFYTDADDNGYFSIDVPPLDGIISPYTGQFTEGFLINIGVKVFARNTAACVHSSWEYYTGIYQCNWGIHYARIDFSPPPYILYTTQIGLPFKKSYDISHTFYGESAQKIKILEILLDDSKKSLQKTGRTVGYVEVSYPVYAGTVSMFYLPIGKLRELDFHISNSDIPGLNGWHEACFDYNAFHQIVITSGNNLFSRKGIVELSHEWSHGFMTEIFGRKILDTWEWVDHYPDLPFPGKPGMALEEGFADFWAGALWVDEMGENVGYDPTTNQFYFKCGTKDLEEYYRPEGHPPKPGTPYWRGGGHNLWTNDGRIVEGAVFQFFWDLFDSPQTNDHTPYFDDDGYSGNLDRIQNVLSILGNNLVEHDDHFDFDTAVSLGEIWFLGTISIGELDTIRLHGKTATLQNRDLQFLDRFKDIWLRELACGNIDEIWNVDFFGTKPPAPGRLTASATENSVTLKWIDQAENEGAYIISMKGEGETQWREVVLDKNSHSYTDEGLESNTTYYYKVASLTCDTSAWAGLVSIRTKALNPPTNLRAHITGPASVLLTWEDNSSNEAGYEVWMKKEVGEWRIIDTTSANQHEDTISGLEYGKAYEFRVRGYTQSYYSDFSNTITLKMLLSPPKDFEAVVRYPYNSVYLRWRDTLRINHGYILKIRKMNGAYQTYQVPLVDSFAFSATPFVDYACSLKAYIDTFYSDVRFISFSNAPQFHSNGIYPTVGDGKKLVYKDGKLHIVYVSGNKVIYRASSDGGLSWGDSLIVYTEREEGWEVINPVIDVSENGDVVIAWSRWISSQAKDIDTFPHQIVALYYSYKRNNETSFSEPFLIEEFSYGILPGTRVSMNILPDIEISENNRVGLISVFHLSIREGDIYPNNTFLSGAGTYEETGIVKGYVFNIAHTNGESHLFYSTHTENGHFSVNGRVVEQAGRFNFIWTDESGKIMYGYYDNNFSSSYRWDIDFIDEGNRLGLIQSGDYLILSGYINNNSFMAYKIERFSESPTNPVICPVLREPIQRDYTDATIVGDISCLHIIGSTSGWGSRDIELISRLDGPEVQEFISYTPDNEGYPHGIVFNHQGDTYIGIIYSKDGDIIYKRRQLLPLPKSDIQTEKSDKKVLEFNLRVRSIAKGNAHVEITNPIFQKIDLAIYNADGRKINSLISKELKRGIYKTNWQIKNRSGIYFVVLKGIKDRKVKKIIVIK